MTFTMVKNSKKKIVSNQDGLMSYFIWKINYSSVSQKLNLRGKALATDHRRFDITLHDMRLITIQFHRRRVLRVQSATKLAIACRVLAVTRRVPYW